MFKLGQFLIGSIEYISELILDGLHPVVPDLSDDYVGAGDGEKPSSDGGLSAPVDATPTQVGPVGERPTSSASCKICGGSGSAGKAAIDLKTELDKANKRIDELEAELKHAREAGMRENLCANNEIEQKLKAMAEAKFLRGCLDKIQDHLSRVYQGYYDKS